MNNTAKSLMRGIDVLLVIKTNGYATANQIQQQVLKDIDKRSVQRYLKTLVEAGLIYKIGKTGYEYKFYLTGKSLQLFGVLNENC